MAYEATRAIDNPIIVTAMVVISDAAATLTEDVD